MIFKNYSQFTFFIFAFIKKYHKIPKESLLQKTTTMSYDKQLKFASKYNWWTKEEDKKGIDLKTKMSYILSKWTLAELVYVIKNFDKDTIISSYKLIKKDEYQLKPRRKYAIKTLLKEKDNNKL